MRKCDETITYLFKILVTASDSRIIARAVPAYIDAAYKLNESYASETFPTQRFQKELSRDDALIN